jgi:hypothetical protein
MRTLAWKYWLRFWLFTLDFLPERWAPWIVGIGLLRWPQKMK